MERRELLRWLTASAGLGGLERIAPHDLLSIGRAVHARAATTGARALDPHATAIVTAAAERIIPASDTPGATDVGVAAFIDHMLADWYAPEERDHFLAGLRQLDARSRSRWSRAFLDCTPEEQTAVLADSDAAVASLRGEGHAGEANRHWFGMLKFLTVWGYCTTEAAASRTLGEYPPVWRYDGCAPYTPPARH
jgi:gluconate 2-dehydrogenase gamma chain